LEDQLIDKVRALPPNKQLEALRLLDTLAGAGSDAHGTGVDRRPIWEVVEEVNAGLPADTWENVPTDGSINLDHYAQSQSSVGRDPDGRFGMSRSERKENVHQKNRPSSGG
jgi:hypothetical protein